MPHGYITVRVVSRSQPANGKQRVGARKSRCARIIQQTITVNNTKLKLLQ
jgi:hypothetical protein